MNRITHIIASLAICLGVSQVMAAQELTDAQKAAAEAAKAITEAPEAEKKEEKPKYWDESLKTNIKFGQTSLTNWAAGGDNTVTLQAFIDGNANYKKNDLFWNNRLQLDYGFVYASSKPILQKSDDRIYFESKFGYKNAQMRNFSFSANYDFKSQFSTGYDYKTPDNLKDENGNDLEGGDLRQAWRDARKTKSGFLAPAYTNLALGIDLKPWKWLSLNIAPLTGGVVIVKDVDLRKNYGMDLKEAYKDASKLSPEALDKFNEDMSSDDPALIGQYYRGARFEFGAQVKADIAVKVNDGFAYTSQLVLFSNYLDHPENLRVNWDNRFDWKIAKYFSLTLTTNMIYDDKVLIFSEKDGLTKQRVQFKESLLFGFTYTIARKR
ncbi:MAG: DUF3078 domain-containing protein [Bacteroidales bacterium]|nr:DUF3078 domain-containing protein [Bacteroidales bacterium]